MRCRVLDGHGGRMQALAHAYEDGPRLRPARMERVKDFKKTRHMVCALCSKRRGLVRYSSKIRECDRCREDPELRLVTKSTAMKLFLEQLEGVRCIRAPNPHGSSAPDMRLYRVKDLRAMKAVPEPC